MKIKCIKCGLRFKDREDPRDKGLVNKELCWNCRFVWDVIGMTLQSLGNMEVGGKKLNREVQIRLEDVYIRKEIKH